MSERSEREPAGEILSEVACDRVEGSVLPAPVCISRLFFTAIFGRAHLMHSRRRFALETVTVLQYRCPQSGTSLMHTAVAALRNGSGNNASSGSRQLRPMPLRGARTVCVALGTRNHCAAEPASSRYGCVLCRQSAAAMSRGKLPLSARQQAHSAPCKSAPGWLVRSGERRLRGLRPTVLESCLIVRSVGGWPAGRTAFSGPEPPHAGAPSFPFFWERVGSTLFTRPV